MTVEAKARREGEDWLRRDRLVRFLESAVGESVTSDKSTAVPRQRPVVASPEREFLVNTLDSTRLEMRKNDKWGESACVGSCLAFGFGLRKRECLPRAAAFGVSRLRRWRTGRGRRGSREGGPPQSN